MWLLTGWLQDLDRMFVANLFPILAKKLFIKFALSTSFVMVTPFCFKGPIRGVDETPLNFLTRDQNDLGQSAEEYFSFQEVVFACRMRLVYRFLAFRYSALFLEFFGVSLALSKSLYLLLMTFLSFTIHPWLIDTFDLYIPCFGQKLHFSANVANTIDIIKYADDVPWH